MGFRLIVGAVALMGLAACGGDARDYPALLPTDQVLADPAIPVHAADAARDDSLGPVLDARGRALAQRGSPAPAASDAGLQRRADALRARAKALSQQSPDPRPCAEDQPDCTIPPTQE